MAASSTQVYVQPPNTDAEWLAHHYFEWLGQTIPLTSVQHDDEALSICLWPSRRAALRLRRREHSPERVVFDVVGGYLTRGGVFTFTADCGRFRVCLDAYESRIPRWLYERTQAPAHEVVMWAFGRTLTERHIE